jgi:hypothetical protein
MALGRGTGFLLDHNEDLEPRYKEEEEVKNP